MNTFHWYNVAFEKTTKQTNSPRSTFSAHQSLVRAYRNANLFAMESIFRPNNAPPFTSPHHNPNIPSTHLLLDSISHPSPTHMAALPFPPHMRMKCANGEPQHTFFCPFSVTAPTATSQVVQTRCGCETRRHVRSANVSYLPSCG